MIIKNITLKDKEGFFDILIENGLIKKIDKNIEAENNDEIVDGRGGFAISPFIEPHVHLGATLTAGEPR